MKILLTNDDGIKAPGIEALARSLGKEHEVVVVAPSSAASATSHAITIHESLHATNEKLEGADVAFAVTGFPADCVKLALSGRLIDSYRPDIVISGINAGLNAGVDILYSGTVAAAREGFLGGIPSIAISVSIGKNEPDYTVPAAVLDFLVPKAGELLDFFLNVNVPACPLAEIKGMKVAKVGLKPYREFYNPCKTGRKDHFSLDGVRDPELYKEDEDVRVVSDKFVSLTPLQVDPTSYMRLSSTEGMLVPPQTFIV